MLGSRCDPVLCRNRRSPGGMPGLRPIFLEDGAFQAELDHLDGDRDLGAAAVSPAGFGSHSPAEREMGGAGQVTDGHAGCTEL